MLDPTIAPKYTPEFGTTGENLDAARSGRHAFISRISTYDGKRYVATTIDLNKPMSTWKHSEFFGSETIETRADFVAHVEELAVHFSQRDRFDRQPEDGSSSRRTPWGTANQSIRYGEGIVSHSTPSHGGIHLSRRENAKVHPAWRIAGGWYEEDSDWAIVAFTFPQFFTDYERKHARKTLRRWYTKQYESVTGENVPVEESVEKQKNAWLERAKNHWVVQAALGSDENPGFVETVARFMSDDGKLQDEERRYLVATKTYRTRCSNGFIIDENRDALYTGPTGFMTMQHLVKAA